jgi:Kef-type K+ transport system membrane component KefB
LVVLGLSIFVALVIGTGTTWNVVWIFLRMLLYVGIATAIGWVFLPKVSQKIEDLPISQGLLAFVLIGTLFYAWAAEVLGGMAAITGAFLAGLLFARSPSKDRIEAGMSSIAYSFFVPIFFVNVGLVANIRLLTGDSLWLLLGMILVAIISKVLGSGIGGRLAGLTNLESIQLGAGMTSRGEVGLIVANVGIVEGLIGPDIFVTVVGVVIATTLLTPAMLRILFARGKPTDYVRLRDSNHT